MRARAPRPTTWIFSASATCRRCVLQLARRDHAEVVLLAARQDRVGDLVVLGRGEDELHARRRLLERLQERVEGARREHVDLVDDPDLEAVARGVVARRSPAARGPARRRCCVAPSISCTSRLRAVRDLAAAATAHVAAAGLGGGGRRPCAQLSALARMRAVVVLPTPRAPESRKAWPMRPDAERVLQRARDGRLPDDLVEGLGPVLAGEDLVAQGAFGSGDS